MVFSKSTVCKSKSSKFNKKKETSRLFSELEIKRFFK